MTDTEFHFEQLSQDHRGLGKDLPGAKWRRYQLPDQQSLVCCELPWSLDLDPYHIFDAAGQDWRIIWRSRSDQALKLAVGLVLQTPDTQDPLLTMTGAESWFVAQPFDSISKLAQESSWQDLYNGFVILPQVEWHLPPTGDATLTVRAILPNLLEHQQVEKKLAEVLRAHIPLTLGEGHDQIARPAAVEDVPSYEAWRAMVLKAVEAIKAGELSKVVLSRSKVLRFAHDFDWAPILRNLAKLDERSYFFAVKSPKGQGFIGRSPERLLAWDHDFFYIDAIAGTRQRSSIRSEDFTKASQLRSSSKDLQEHRFVSDYVAGILNHHKLDFETMETESLLRLRNVQHMRTRFRALRRELVNPLALLNDLHPTPAVGGLPKEKARQFIVSHEVMERGLFSGSFGCLKGLNYGDLAIGIRSALFHPQEIRLYAGAGIVEDSDPDWEWQETEIKMKNFSDLFEDRRV